MQVRTKLKIVQKVNDNLTDNLLSTNYRSVYTYIFGIHVFLTIDLGFYWIMKRIEREKVSRATK